MPITDSSIDDCSRAWRIRWEEHNFCRRATSGKEAAKSLKLYGRRAGPRELNPEEVVGYSVGYEFFSNKNGVEKRS